MLIEQLRFIQWWERSKVAEHGYSGLENYVVDTGLHSNIGQRLKAAEEYLEGEETFLANYSDGLTDLPLHDYIDSFRKSKKIACFLAVKPTSSFHVVEIDNGKFVRSIRHLSDSSIWMNGGFFVFRKEIFRHIRPGEELVNEPFQRLIEKKGVDIQQVRGLLDMHGYIQGQATPG